MEPILIHQCGYLFVSEWDRDPDHSHDPHFHLYKMSDECLQEYGPLSRFVKHRSWAWRDIDQQQYAQEFLRQRYDEEEGVLSFDIWR